MFNELPTMENLKKRKPNVYKEHYLCPRCEQKEETLEHLWSCPRADNDILELQMLAREKLTKLLRKSKKIKNIDDTMEEIFPFLKIKKQLKGYTKESSIFYGNIEKKSSLQQYTYVWDGINSMDNILKGWIPKNLISTLRKHLVNDNKLTVKNILTKWVNKVNIMFFDLIWKKRNEDMLQWEHRNNIDIKDKKNSSLKQKQRLGSEQSRRSKSEISGKKRAKFHVIDETLYYEVKGIFGFDQGPCSSILGYGGSLNM